VFIRIIMYRNVYSFNQTSVSFVSFKIKGSVPVTLFVLEHIIVYKSMTALGPSTHGSFLWEALLTLTLTGKFSSARATMTGRESEHSVSRSRLSAMFPKSSCDCVRHSVLRSVVHTMSGRGGLCMCVCVGVRACVWVCEWNKRVQTPSSFSQLHAAGHSQHEVVVNVRFWKWL